MPTAKPKTVKLTIRDVPVELNERIVEAAKAEGRSANKQVLQLLDEAFAARDAARKPTKPYTGKLSRWA